MGIRRLVQEFNIDFAFQLFSCVSYLCFGFSTFFCRCSELVSDRILNMSSWLLKIFVIYVFNYQYIFRILEISFSTIKMILQRSYNCLWSNSSHVIRLKYCLRYVSIIYVLVVL